MFNKAKAKKMLEENLGHSAPFTYVKTEGPKSFGNGKFFQFTIERAGEQQVWDVHDTGAVVKEEPLK